MDFKKFTCDVLVIGSGAAAMRASIEASNLGASVLLASKGKIGHSGSTFYPLSLPWGIMWSDNDEKDKDDFLNEIVRASCGCLNKKLVEVMVDNSYDRFQDLIGYGVKFRALADTNEKPCFGDKPRGTQLIDIRNFENSLLNEIQSRNIKTCEGIYIFDLLISENRCYGAVGLDSNNEFVIIGSKTVIFATGGAESLWKYNFSIGDLVGDAQAIAARYGARLANMEFIQFIPGTLQPIRGINFHHPTLASIPKVLNSFGEEFLYKYLPEDVSLEECLLERAKHGPFSNEDKSRYFDIGICLEAELEGNQNFKGAQIEYSDKYYSSDKYLEWDNYIKSKRIEVKKQNISIYPFCQGFNGGILINEFCETDIENLYACGECAGGPHGANRIGGNAILGTQVFGKIAGEEAAKKAKKIISGKSHEYRVDLEKFDWGNMSNISPSEVLQEIKTVMQNSASIVKDGKRLIDGINKIEAIKKEFNCSSYINSKQEFVKALKGYNSLITSSIILKSMLHRKESRGSYYRADYPDKNQEYEAMSYITILNNEIKLI